jgi:hypothetical protein
LGLRGLLLRISSRPKAAKVKGTFDKHQFFRHGRLLRNSNISFQDFERMSVKGGESHPERRLATPAWSLSDEKTQAVLVAYLENRFYVNENKIGTLKERLGRCQTAAQFYIPGKKELLAAWIRDFQLISKGKFADLPDDDAQAQFASLQENDGQAALTPQIARDALTNKKLSALELQIMNTDSDLYLAEKGYAEVCCAIIYLYHRMLYNSVSISETLGLKSPHVRQILSRIGMVGQELFPENAPTTQAPAEPMFAAKLSQVADEIGGTDVNPQAQAELNAATGVVRSVPADQSSNNFREVQCAAGL